MAKKRKIRVELRKNRSKPAREQGWTREFRAHGFADDDGVVRDERVRAKGDLSRKRTIIAEEKTASTVGADNSHASVPAVDLAACLSGRVLRVQGLFSHVACTDGRQYRCTVRRVLRSLVIDERSIVATGDQVWIRPVAGEEGVIEQVEPRHGTLTRASRGREQVMVANVDQVVFVVSLAEPAPKPHLIDRFLVSAEKGKIRPIVCFNKADLVDLADFQPLFGLYAQLGIAVLLTSAADGRGIDELRKRLTGKQTVFSGQSGVGKSSLLNAVEPELALKIGAVSDDTQKGKHTTTTAVLIPLSFAAWVVDTPGIRQFALWDVQPGELEGYFPEFRPLVPLCRFSGCTHTHEEACAVKDAVARRRIARQRYETYVGLFTGKEKFSEE